jgi:hypothetical protein
MAACSSVKVDADYETDTDFEFYTTYAWAPQPAPNTPLISDLVVERIKSAVDRELGVKGLKKDVPDQASMQVKYRISIAEKLQVNDPYYAYNQFQTYEEGTLLLDFVDTKTRNLVWRGSGQTRLKELKTPEERTQRINKVVGAILDQYPPK